MEMFFVYQFYFIIRSCHDFTHEPIAYQSYDMRFCGLFSSLFLAATKQLHEWYFLSVCHTFLTIIGRSRRRRFPDHAFMPHCTFPPPPPVPAGGPSPQSLATVFIIIFVFPSPRPLPCINKKFMNSDGHQMAWTVRSARVYRFSGQTL